MSSSKHHSDVPSPTPALTSSKRQADSPVECLPFNAVVGSALAVNATLTLDIEQFVRIDPETLPSGVRVTVVDGRWQPITLARQGNLLDVEVRLDSRKGFARRRRRAFVGALSSAATSLEWEDKISNPDVDVPGYGQHIVVRWKESFPSSVTLAETLKEVRFHWDVLLNRAEKMLTA